MDKKLISSIFEEFKKGEIKIKRGEKIVLKLPDIPLIKETEDVRFQIELDGDQIEIDDYEEIEGRPVPREVKVSALKTGKSKLKINPLDAFTDESVDGIDPFEMDFTVEE